MGPRPFTGPDRPALRVEPARADARTRTKPVLDRAPQAHREEKETGHELDQQIQEEPGLQARLILRVGARPTN